MGLQDFATPGIELEPAAERLRFDARFDRCRTMLFVIASRLLGADDEAAEAVANCRAAASRNPPKLASEPAFRSWLARVLIDEALAIFRNRGAAARESRQDGGCLTSIET